MKYLRRNQDEPQPDLKTSMADFKKARFGANSKIGAGLARLPEFQRAVFVDQQPAAAQGIGQIKPLLTRADLAFLNEHGNEAGFPLNQPSIPPGGQLPSLGKARSAQEQSAQPVSAAQRPA